MNRNKSLPTLNFEANKAFESILRGAGESSLPKLPTVSR